MNQPGKNFRRLLLFCCFLALSLAAMAQGTDASRFTVHTVQQGDSLFRIALQYDLFAEQVARANGISDGESIYIGQQLIIPLVNLPADQRLTHVVADGETLTSIAAAYSQRPTDLLELNNLASAEAITVGQELVIVAGEGASAPAAASDAESQSDEPATSADQSAESTASTEQSGEATTSADQPAEPAASTEQPAEPTASNAPPHSFARFGTQSEIFSHIVQAGQTMSEISLRYNQSIESIASVNNLADPGLLRIGQRLVIPGIQLPQLMQELPPIVRAFTIDPLVFEEGRSGRIELVTSEAATMSGQFLDQSLRVISDAAGQRHNIIVGTPMFTPMDVYPLNLEIITEMDELLTLTATVQVVSGGYWRQSLTIDDSELLSPEVEEEELALLTSLAGYFSPERTWQNSLSLPSAAATNALFGILRSYNDSPFDRYHRGVDFAGAPGSTVLAAADGTVVLADRLHIRGNTVMIDHGWGVYTLYAHQQEFYVAVGDAVSAGQIIGAVGSTGRSTGPHLHWELWLNGVTVDPMQWVRESFP